MDILSRLARKKQNAKIVAANSLPRLDISKIKKPSPIEAFLEDREYDDLPHLDKPVFVDKRYVSEIIYKEQPDEYVNASDGIKTTYIHGREMKLNSTHPYDGYFNRRSENESTATTNS